MVNPHGIDSIMASPSSMDHLKDLQNSQLFQQIESLKQPSQLDALLDSTQICKQLGIAGQSRRELQAQRTLFREQLEDLRDMLLEQVNCRSLSQMQRRLCMVRSAHACLLCNRSMPGVSNS